MKDIPKTYAPHEIEEKWYRFWLERDYFHAADKSDKPPFSIVIPPPNITGSLHVGHALDNTLQDILTRWRRMQGYNALWMPGTDHAGIVTEIIMEKKLATWGTSREELGRKKFIERMWNWKDESRGTIIDQLQSIGCSCDWARERFTLDDGLSKAVRTAFVKLYNDGLIYRGEYMVNWCPNCRTAVSDLEVEPVEIDGNFYHIKYPIRDAAEFVEIATTRPETMLGDTAVAVHPEDERYQHLIGKTAILPILERELPIIADAYVDWEFGTGALKVTPAHDPNDYEIGQRHQLDQVNIFNPDGTLNENAGPKYQGMDRLECRKALVADLHEGEYLIKVVPHRHAVGHHDRCDQIIEPYISPQWYLNVKPLAERSMEAAQRGEVVFIPERETKRFYQWMENIQPWAISRQRWWGHQLPIWYCDDCDEITVAVDTPESCSHCNSEHIRQDEDVLDTWFSSGLWPFSTMGWPEETELLKTFYPTSVLVTGWDILFFWVARMIMLGLHCMGEVPFRHVYLHGLIADEHGQKMSKSRGNTIDPVLTVDKYGADAFRFALAFCTLPNPYMPLPESQIEAGKRFANKIWNASRFLLMNLDDFHPSESESQQVKPLRTRQASPLLCDRWIRSRFSATVQNVTIYLEEFRFSDAAHCLYEFLWHEFCDWYIELIKQRLYYADDPAAKHTAQAVAAEVLEGTMRLLHPMMPFITEEIWQRLPHKGESVVVAPWPAPNAEWADTAAEDAMQTIMNVIESIRSIRGEMNVPPSSEVEVLIQAPDRHIRDLLAEHLVEYLPAFTRFSRISIAEHQEKPPAAASAVIGALLIYIPLAGVIDIEKEKSRLQRRLDKVMKDFAGTQKTLDNPRFLDRAPEAVVEQKRTRLEELDSEKEKLEATMRMLG
ncbi:MAG: valine--tRNA ligase [Candidatus Poribacteria bacterium]|nr:valine--tRNA ligase [Candidatus Poribacteria bacterium]